ncbi:JAB domain-containing protein [bacterium]|nr:JAB domain-containing protein [bacterium]
MNEFILDPNIELSETFPELKLSYTLPLDSRTKVQITNPESAYQWLMKIWDKGTIQYKEEFLIILLNNSKYVIGWSKISSGGSNATIVEPAMVFQIALLAHANSIILAHNHPSGRMVASSADINLTKRLNEIGKILGLEIDDHLIITLNGFLSLKTNELY